MDCKPSILDLQRSILDLPGNIYIISSDHLTQTIAKQIRRSLDSHLTFSGSLFRNDLRSLYDTSFINPSFLYNRYVKSEAILTNSLSDRRREVIDLTQVPEIPASSQPQRKKAKKPRRRSYDSNHGINLFGVENYEEITEYKKWHHLSRTAARLKLWSKLGKAERKEYSNRTIEINAQKKVVY
jgi:hypothetical protein